MYTNDDNIYLIHIWVPQKVIVQIKLTQRLISSPFYLHIRNRSLIYILIAIHWSADHNLIIWLNGNSMSLFCFLPLSSICSFLLCDHPISHPRFVRFQVSRCTGHTWYYACIRLLCAPTRPCLYQASSPGHAAITIYTRHLPVPFRLVQQTLPATDRICVNVIVSRVTFEIIRLNNTTQSLFGGVSIRTEFCVVAIALPKVCRDPLTILILEC